MTTSLRNALAPVRLVATVFVLGTSSFALATAASAQCASPAPVNPAAMAEFNADPAAYLGKVQPGGALVAAIRNLAVSDPTAVSKIADFAKATPSAKSDIGTGLGQAAKICVPTQFTQAQALQQAVIALNDPLVLTAFLAVTGDIATTATGGGAGGGGGGPGGAGINSSVASSGAGGSFARSTATGTTVNGTFSISPGSGASVTTTNAITQAAAAVSP